MRCVDKPWRVLWKHVASAGPPQRNTKEERGQEGQSHCHSPWACRSAVVALFSNGVTGGGAPLSFRHGPRAERVSFPGGPFFSSIFNSDPVDWARLRAAHRTNGRSLVHFLAPILCLFLILICWFTSRKQIEGREEEV